MNQYIYDEIMGAAALHTFPALSRFNLELLIPYFVIVSKPPYINYV